jgi:hypothetical protein
MSLFNPPVDQNGSLATLNFMVNEILFYPALQAKALQNF